MGVIEDNKEYLKHKHQGDISSSKGNTNEDFYATYQLASYMADIHPEDVILYGQKENSFVDDLYIDAHGTNIYVQVKAVKSLTWNSGINGHSILSDFELQKRACEESNEADFKLRLVYSNEQSNIKAIPYSIKECTEVEHFKSADDINACILANDSFKNALHAITNYTNQDDIVALGTAIFGQWATGNKKNISVSSVIDGLKNIKSQYLALKFTPVFLVTEDCRSTFDRIGVTFTQKGNLVSFTFKSFASEKIWNEGIDKAICDGKPSNIFDLLQIINQH